MLYEKALDVYEKKLQICRELGNRDAEGRTLNNLGSVYHMQQRWEDAIQAYEESLRIKQELGYDHLEGITLVNLGIVYNQRGDRTKALEKWLEAGTKLQPNSPQHEYVIEQLREAG